MGVSVCLFREPSQAKNIYITTDYQAASGSFDSGKSNPEGSRPAFALFLHASLYLIGQKGYEQIINKGIKNARYLVHCIQEHGAFELLWNSTINIVNYRYIPKAYRDHLQNHDLTVVEQDEINQANLKIQARQFNKGKTFISKTWLPYLVNFPSEQEVVAFRAVLANPLTSENEILQVLQDQLILLLKSLSLTPILKQSLILPNPQQIH